MSRDEKIARISKLTEIYEWTKKLPHKFTSLSDQILYEMLNLGLEINNYNFDHFIQYLKDPKQVAGVFNTKL